ncbi:MAG: Crp/Fnr family transcriptional regulator [Lentimicrobium sp.]|uniref:Crp/Fnr family transcriptional regulator n=1 Tax=Lentimicrobium sp. TaxID=2034841 RepID=UPI0025E26F12|nr:Crp/Fnr family transcriptional regulator [Lentimicrobium sp.]MCO5255211.1 Crp/Fnr family transcriptional regulator [Lentimicrobium sp.]HPF63400.1 Crp/Fnr family transcriptional regulator [Lentimicrobium sp.]HRW69002.1 Crp/Fnr family transcriptional regulator [Lentimicrobium sp.]
MELKISDLIAKEMFLTPEEIEAVDTLIPIKEFKKGRLLLEEGSIAKECYFNIKGCVRSYQILNGEEKTTQFFIEGDPIASLLSYLNKTPANHYFECIEDCTLAVLSFDNEQRLYKQYPKFEALCRNSIEQEFGKQQEVLQNYLTRNPEERYLMLQETRPELLQRVPQYHLATFLGVQPESLSRIRKRIAQKNKS